jgi:type II secretory pathway component PulF
MKTSTTFAFRAAALDGRIDAGHLDAESPVHARQLLTARGLFVLDVVARGPAGVRRRRMSDADLALGLRILADLLDSGLSVARALRAFAQLAPKGWRQALPAIQQSIKQGESFAAALASAPVELPSMIIGIAQAGEAGAGLAQAIRRAAELTDSTVETRAAIRSALVYPAVVAVAGVLAIVVLVTVVLPKFALILADLGQELPASTRLVLQLANAARAAVLPGGMGIAACLAARSVALRSPAGKRREARALLALPLIGSMRRGSAVGRVARSLATLLDGGVPLSTALSIAARSSGDAELEARLSDVRNAVAGGEMLSRALDAFDAATPTTVRLVRAGEESGRLAAMLHHAARLEQLAADRVARTFARLLEPALLLVFASIVAFVAAALLQAIYSVRPAA